MLYEVITYYGTEIGMEGGSDPDNRRDMEWDTIEDNEMLSFYMELTDIRAAITDRITSYNVCYTKLLRYNEKEPFWFIGIFNGFGGDVMDDSYNPTLNTEAMVKALQFAKVV